MTITSHPKLLQIQDDKTVGKFINAFITHEVFAEIKKYCETI